MEWQPRNIRNLQNMAVDGCIRVVVGSLQYNRSALREERLIHVGVLHLFAMTIGVPVRSNIEHGRQCW